MTGHDSVAVAIPNRHCYTFLGARGAVMQNLDELFRQHGAMVYRRAYRILGDRADAEEATQEVFLRVMRSGEGFEGRSSVTSWLYRITTNHCLNLIRDRSRRRELMAEHGPALSREGEDRSAEADLVTVRRLLAEADEKHARAAVYVYMDGMSYREAASVLGVSKRTVGNLLDRFQTWAQARLAEQAQADRAEADQATSAAGGER